MIPVLDAISTLRSFAINPLVNGLILGVFIVLFDTLNQKFGFVKPEVLDGTVVYSSLRDLCYLVFPYLKALFFKA